MKQRPAAPWFIDTPPRPSYLIRCDNCKHRAQTRMICCHVRIPEGWSIQKYVSGNPPAALEGGYETAPEGGYETAPDWCPRVQEAISTMLESHQPYCKRCAHLAGTDAPYVCFMTGSPHHNKISQEHIDDETCPCWCPKLRR